MYSVHDYHYDDAKLTFIFAIAYGVPCTPIHGPPFEVLDWKTGTPRRGAYLRLADPFVWRSVDITLSDAICDSHIRSLVLGHS